MRFPLACRCAEGLLAACLLGSAMTVDAATAPVLLAEPSTSLAFTQREVEAHAAIAKRDFLQEAAARQELACLSHCAQIQRVWQRLLPVIRAQHAGNIRNLRLKVVHSSRIDALSFPDGLIVISERMVSRRHLNAEQIAFVLAHEASHVLLQHERQSLTSALAILPPNVPHATVAQVYSDIEANYFRLDDALATIAQQSEFEADEVGLLMAALAGFNPQRQLRFMEQLAVQPQGQSMLATHPEAGQRLARLRQRLPLAQRLYGRGKH
jgi:predicted Zn-dependent protease